MVYLRKIDRQLNTAGNENERSIQKGKAQRNDKLSESVLRDFWRGDVGKDSEPVFDWLAFWFCNQHKISSERALLCKHLTITIA